MHRGSIVRMPRGMVWIGIIRMVNGRVRQVIGVTMERVRRRRVIVDTRYRLGEYIDTKTWKIKKE
jgi:hypothetical protein